MPLRSSEFENGGKWFLKKRHYQAARLYDVASQRTVILIPLWEITHISHAKQVLAVLGSCSKVVSSSVDIIVPSVAQSWIAF